VLVFDEGKKMTQDRIELEQIGHKKRPLLRAIRENCVDCVGGYPYLVKECELSRCPLYPYRMGKNPFSGRKGNPDAFKK